MRSDRASGLAITVLATTAMVLAATSARADGAGNVDTFYGSFGTEVPIEAPKFFDIAPKVKVAYVSAGGNGFAGVGWGMSGFGAITRSQRGGGAPRYDATDVFVFDGQELVSCATGSTSPSCLAGGTHSTRIESYAKIAYDSGSNSWSVWQKDGTRTTYSSLLTTTSGTYRWGISAVRDTHANAVSYGWWCDPGADCYRDTISYNGTVIRFYREARPDALTFATGAGLGRTSYRLKSIDVTVSGVRARAYALAYSPSSATNRSLLSSVRQYGRDAVVDASGNVSGSSLPALTVGYGSAGVGFGAAYNRLTQLSNGVAINYSTISSPDINGDGKADVCWRSETAGYLCALATGGGSFGTVTLALAQLRNGYCQVGFGTCDEDNWRTITNPDVNGDGKADVCWRGDYGYYCALSNGNGTFGAVTLALSQLGNNGCHVSGGACDGDNWQTIRNPDVNGDGKADVCWRGDSGLYCALSNGNGTFGAVTLALSQLANGACHVSGGACDADNWRTIAYPDVNGDGRSDVCWRGDSGYYCALSNGNGTFGTVTLALSQLANGACAVTGNCDDDNWQTISNPDVNGDGKSDVCWRGDNGYYCALSNGNGTFGTVRLALSQLGNGLCQVSGGACDGDNWTTISNPDINGDGLSDVCWRGDSGYYCARSLGDGTFGAPFVTVSALANGVSAASGGDNNSDNYPTIRPADIDGDGKADLCWRGDSGYFCALGNAGLELVTSVQNGLGGSTSIAYAPSSQWSNTFLPIGTVMQTVSSLTTGDGRGASGTTSYRYEGALWSTTERRFLGFRKVTGVLDAAGNYTETYYHQHNGCVSKPETTYYRNAAGAIFSYSSYTYAENTVAPYTSVLTDRWDYECNLGGTCRRVLTQIGYDAYGNAIQTKEWGDYDVAGDERTTVRGYYVNGSAYIAAKTAYENVYEGIGTAGSLERQTLFEYDDNTTYAAAPTIGELRRKKLWNGTTGGYALTSYRYDARGNLTSETDPLGYTSTTAWDTTYGIYPVRKCDPLGRCSTQAWNGSISAMTSMTDANGYTTSFSFDTFGRPSRRTYPDGGWIQYDYLDWGNPNAQRTRETRSDGSADGLWRDVYQDGLGRTYLTEEEGGYEQATLYSDTSSRVWKKSLKYGSGQSPVYQTFAYDGAGRLRTVTNPDGTVAQTLYANGQLTTLNELGHEKVTRKDGLGRITQVLEKVAGAYKTTQYRYDALGNLVQTTDAAGSTSTFTWDSLGHKIGQCDPDLGCWSYGFDAGGKLVSQTDAKGKTITFAYDPLGRMTTKTLPDGAQSRWTYDEAGHGAALGKPTSIVNAAGSESLTYDWAGRVTSATRCVTGTCLTTGYSFDTAGRPRSITYPDGEVVTYAYGTDGRLQSMGYASFAYNAAGQPTRITYANGTTTAYTYDNNRMWLTSARVTAAGTTLYESTYGYDAAARVTSMSSTGSNGALRSSTFGYDELSRLTSSTRDGQAWQSFTYDAVGNMTGQDYVGMYGYGDAAHKHAVTAAGSDRYAYDQNGNMVSGGGRTFAWDAENHLASVTQGGVTTAFKYDPSGQRVEKSGGSTVRYFGQLLEKRDGLAETKYYYAGSMLVAERRWDGNVYYHHRDHVSSVRLTTNGTGALARRYEYRPFGLRDGTSGTVQNEWEYGGHQTDAESGLVYMGARFYDPLIGRFLSPDTLVPDPYNPQALNRYAYVLNNPISNADPSGHAPVVAAVVTAVMVAAETAPAWVTAMAYVGAATTVAGYVLQDPTLMTIGGVLLGFSGGYAFGAGFLAGPGTAGGLVTATVAAAASPLSPLDPGIKQAVGWAFAAQSLAHGLWGDTDLDVTDPKWSEDPKFAQMREEVQAQLDASGKSAEALMKEAKAAKGYGEDLALSKEIGHYGSEVHQKFGLAVEKLTGGRITMQQAMQMSPCGGMVGSGCGASSQMLSGIFPKGAIYQHAIVHDASGFLKTNFNVGAGYTYAGQLILGSANPLGGQLTGILYNMRGRWVPGLATSYTDND